MASRTVPDCKATVLATLQTLFTPGMVVELRVLQLKPRGNTASGYFSDFAKLAEAADQYNGNGGVYITVNPVDPALLARANNRARVLQYKESSTTSDVSVHRSDRT